MALLSVVVASATEAAAGAAGAANGTGTTVSQAAAVAMAPTSAAAGSDAGVPAYIQAASQGQVTPPDIEDVEHMCALLTSCDKLPFPPSSLPTSVPSCVSAFMKELTSPDAVKFSLTIRECGLRANSCTELRACALRGAEPAACAGRGKDRPVGICDLDGRAINCWHEAISGVRDCPRGGEQCIIRNGQPDCSLGPCTDENKEGGSPTCSGNGQRVLQCDHGKLRSLDCAAFGLKCTMDGGKAGCAPPTAACAQSGTRCEGNVAVGCEHGHEVKIDCGASGLTCSGNAGPTALGSCVSSAPAAGEKCDPKDPPKCEGATIRYCLAGRKRSYFCKSLGFNRCLKEGQTVHCDM
jgi:hypothetical protein